VRDGASGVPVMGRSEDPGPKTQLDRYGRGCAFGPQEFNKSKIPETTGFIFAEAGKFVHRKKYTPSPVAPRGDMCAVYIYRTHRTAKNTPYSVRVYSKLACPTEEICVRSTPSCHPVHARSG
jgi:hypothetical protein